MSIQLCIFTSDLDTIALRKAALLAHVRELTGADPFEDVCVAGYRPSEERRDGAEGYLPAGQYTYRMRIANKLFRLVDRTRWVPTSIARVGVWLCTPWLIEVLLACDPDIVLLDVRWGRHLKRALEKEFPGEVLITGAEPRSKSRRPQWRKCDPTKKVSIVLPTHNGSKYIRQSIQSCLDQSFRNIELIVVDDGSTEDMGAILSEFSDPRIRHVRHERNRGLPEALNTGFGVATGEYLTWTSDDNYYGHDAIERMTRVLQSYPGIDFVYSSSYIVDEMGLGKTLRIQKPKAVEFLKEDNGIGACFLYKRRVYQEIGQYNSAALLAEDYDYWVRVSRKFRMQRLFAPLYYYRFHKDSLTFKHTREEVAERVNLVKQQNRLA